MLLILKSCIDCIRFFRLFETLKFARIPILAAELFDKADFYRKQFDTAKPFRHVLIPRFFDPAHADRQPDKGGAAPEKSAAIPRGSGPKVTSRRSDPTRPVGMLNPRFFSGSDLQSAQRPLGELSVL